MKKPSLLLCYAALALLSACHSSPPSFDQVSAPQTNKSAASSQSHALVGPGALLSTWAKPEIIASMNESDNTRNQQAEKRSENAPIGQEVTWNNPDNGDGGTLVVLRDAYANNGAYCRDFKQTITVASQHQEGTLKACQQPNGSWTSSL